VLSREKKFLEHRGNGSKILPMIILMKLELRKININIRKIDGESNIYLKSLLSFHIMPWIKLKRFYESTP